MVHDSLINAFHYVGLNPLFKKSFDYLTTADFDTLAYGKHNLDGEDLFVLFMEYDTKESAECLMENHKKYIDIQYIVSGEELIGTAIFNKHTPSIPYDNEKDVAFYADEDETILKLQAGQFAIFFPHDLHRPCIKSGKVSKVRKAVFKIRVA
jgi:YhcH/YjgK/YiaL family protein